MTVNLLNALSKSKVGEDLETQTAFFRTHVPSRGPEAYLHTIFKAAPRKLLTEVEARLGLPRIFVEFLAVQNGAHLFSGATYIFGVVQPGALLNRDDPGSLPPFNIEHQNSKLVPFAFPRDKVIAIGGYAFDGSAVCIDRGNGQINIFPRKSTVSRESSWRTFDDWINSEINRLSILFDAKGNRLVDGSKTIPFSEAELM